MLTLPLSAIAEKLGLKNPAEKNITCHGISRDSRTLQAGNLYVAIQGERLDGHAYVAEAYEKGASAALVSHAVDCPIPQLIVEDTVAALGKLSAVWRQQFTLPLIAVTGSNGKTTLKNMIASILKSACADPTEEVLATEGNLNNHIGLPLTLLRLSAAHRYGVLEMGMNHPGEIAYITQLASPTVAVINNAAHAHLEALQSVAGVARAKGEIFLGLQKNGVAILNRDDEFFDYWHGLIGERRYLTFGLKNPADVTAQLIKPQLIQISTPQGKIDVALPLLGQHNVMNALAATAATLAVGIELSAIQAGLNAIKPAPGRLCLHRLAAEQCIIDDTYNANPDSVTAAIHTLASFPGKQILVLGDMKELGTNATDLHHRAGEIARAAGIHHLLTFGELSRAATEGFGDNATHFTDRDLLIAALQTHLHAPVSVLIKGSRSMQMEKVLKPLLPNEQCEPAHH